MNHQLKTLNNESGGTIIGILIVLVIIGILLHPKTSPFAEKYYNFKAETHLKELHSNCGMVWATSSVAMIAAQAAGKKAEEPKECNLQSVSASPAHFKKDRNIDIKILDGSMQGFSATAKHVNGDKMITINASGQTSP